jgi:hypothetical protein
VLARELRELVSANAEWLAREVRDSRAAQRAIALAAERRENVAQGAFQPWDP